MKRILVFLTVVALMVVMLAMSVAPASAAYYQRLNSCTATYLHTGSAIPWFCE